jgi:putative PIN family toxin of toxin-antitoxin system
MHLHAVYDTNVIVSGTLVPGSIPASLVSLALQNVVQLAISPEILEEYRGVLLRPKFGFHEATVTTFLQELQQRAHMVQPTTRVTISPDEPDNRFLECALAADAQYIVTGNIKHFPAQEYQGVKIVTPAEFASFLIK